MIYLDNSATTFIFDDVLQKMNSVYKDMNFNPSSAYNVASLAENEIKQARQIISKSINSFENEIYFTSGGSEGNNTAILGIARANKNKGKHIITSTVEHDCVYNTIKYLQDNEGFDVTFIKPDKYGVINIDSVIESVRDDTILVSLMQVNNELGSINDIQEISKAVKSKNKMTYIHTDAVQSYMKLDIDVKSLNVDLLTASAHKIHAAKGSGFLYVKKNTKITPLIFGGGQENGFRGGTENVAGISALSKAVLIHNNLDTNDIKLTRDYLKSSIEKNISDISINTPDFSAPHIISVSFAGIKSEILLHYLEMDNIYVSTGSACSSKKKVSRILENINIDNKYKDGTIRFSLSYENTKEQMDIVVEKLKKYVDEIRKITKYRR
ncbi:MAG: cysteine desulfurase [Peptostreptococcaceae bacterium]|nr:cysteine desulfurase [Peptostreptococcaceae bacterium]